MQEMNRKLSEQINKGISIIHHELLSSEGGKEPDKDSVLLALAGLKQVRDMMCGDLAFDPKILHINDSAFDVQDPLRFILFLFLLSSSLFSIIHSCLSSR